MKQRTDTEYYVMATGEFCSIRTIYFINKYKYYSEMYTRQNL